MIRNSNIYRRLWYVRKRNIKRINLMLRFAIAAAIMYFIIMVYQSRILLSIFGL